MSNTIKKVKKVAAEVLKVKEAKIVDDSSFVEDLGADSSQSIELIAAFEDAFDIEMDEEDALEIQDVAGAAAFIDKILAKKK